MARFRRFRHQFLPFLPSGAQTRQWRNQALRKLGLARAYEPEFLTNQPEYKHGSLLPLVAAEHVLEHGELSFLQIGAFDGCLGDDIFGLIERYPVRGVLVEPQPGAFARLQQLHGGNQRLLLINAAIDRVNGKRTFYMAANRSVQVASFDRGHLLKHGLAAQEIVSREVDCLTVDDALRLANLERVDLLQVDAEGYDWEILKSIDFDRLQPRILRFEYRHFSRSDLNACLAMLAEQGYRFLTEKLDIIAVRERTLAQCA